MTTNIEIVRAHYAASAQGNIEAMMVDLSPQVRWTEMAGFPCAGTWVGPQQVIDNVFAVLGRDWIGYHVELQNLIDGGDQVVGVGTYHGTFRATGKEMQARVAHVWKLQDGKIVAFEQFTDTLLVRQAMS
ncbi:nuclear transport factor 2 family protein [Ramlibacter sp. WS9]|uniref:nuclear transport factor 2 family protein n=1 Tax=Ramlibacter sp. WS9 TaxID=1882741 RepID=UPI001142E0E5|nr:nuclear transport factor 2 family protein [Ramlibacter sp. WS9]ROZ71271.1 nuclear transport factor 2 family protein [Ramlibacter sp. WS9]